MDVFKSSDLSERPRTCTIPTRLWGMCYTSLVIDVLRSSDLSERPRTCTLLVILIQTLFKFNFIEGSCMIECIILLPKLM